MKILFETLLSFKSISLLVPIIMLFVSYYYNPIVTHHMHPDEFDNYPNNIPYELRDISKYSTIIAIGDLHGDLDQTYKLLQLSGILNKSKEWIANDTILIQTGDIVDRGSQSIQIYLLLMELRKVAQKHNSLVLQILGNHEFLNLNGNYQFVNKLEFIKYGLWYKLWNMNNKIGYFLRHTPVLRIIGNTLFVHAGLTPEILQLFEENDNIINDINKSVLNGLTNPYFDGNFDDDIYSIITGKRGPIWTREFDNQHESDVYDKHICKQVDKTLKKLNIKRMVIGHNTQYNGMPQSKCDGKLWSIDVGISSLYGCHLAALKIDIQNDVASVISPFVSSNFQV
eukprot:406837_1